MVNFGIPVFVGSTGKLGDGGAIVSPVISLDKPERAVSIESEEFMVEGDSALVVGTFRGCSMSGLGSAYGLILPVLQMEGLG